MRKVASALVLAGAIGLLAGAPAQAVQDGDPATPPAAPETKADKSKKVCRTIVRSGTRFSTRVCRSQADWDKDTENMRRYVEDGQNYGSRRDGEMTGSWGSGVSGGPR